MWTNEDLDSERQSLDIELGRRLSQLSENAKFAVGLNQIQRVAVRDLYDSPEHDGATVYIMDVYIHKTQKGLPTANAGESKTDRKRRLQHQQESERPEYDVEHRYSDFRALRQRIYDIVDCTEDQLHPVWCAYCCRMLWLATYGGFPSRFPNKGAVATYTGWRRLQARSRKHKLELFVNQLLNAAKDVSYRHGGLQCERFVSVSRLLQSFLLEPQVPTPSSMCRP